jgi:DNA repair photolyase
MPLTYIASRHALQKTDLPDNFTRALYKVAPYRGCSHGCKYCDGRAEKYYVEGDFEKDINCRNNIPTLLKQELRFLRESGMIAFGSGVTDPYQACEREEQICRNCAEILAVWNRHSTVSLHRKGAELFDCSEGAANPRLPAMVMTKSSLVQRDLAFWEDVNATAGFILLMSLTSLDESLRETMEGGASPFVERIKTLQRFKKAGCTVGVLAMPLLPGISDGNESIQQLYTACAQIGVDFILPGGLTLRPGRQKELYFSILKRFRPDLVHTTRNIYCKERASGAPSAAYSHPLNSRLAAIQRESGIPWLLPHRVYSRLLPPHDVLRILLQDMVELFSREGVKTERLQESAGRYDAWLLGKRHFFRRHRSLGCDWLGKEFSLLLNSGVLSRIISNPRLENLISCIFNENAILDYKCLQLSNP